MKIGEEIRFVPAAWTQFTEANVLENYGAERSVRGKIVGIHRGHRYYRVEYEANGYINYECFKFQIPSLEDQENENGDHS